MTETDFGQVNGNAPAQKLPKSSRAESVGSDGTVPQEKSEDEETSWSKQLEYANKFISRLRTASYEVNASVLYNNDHLGMHTANAYARVSGRTWTYFVKDTSFTIGRPVRPAKVKPQASSASPAHSDGAGSGGDFPVHIDLGPDQQVSRVHAIVSFRPDEELWAIAVNGRNGLLVDDKRLEKGQESYLHSGAVISILGTQMMFTLPQAPFVVHPSIIAQTTEEGETEDDVVQDQRLQHRGAAGGRQNGSQALNTQAKGYGSSASQTNYHQASQTVSTPGTPLTVRSKDAQMKAKPSPAYGRGLVLETTEDIDYAADSARDIKPPHSYAQLIGQAIISSPEQKLTLAKIYEFIKEHYAFYRHSGGGWQNSIRHNLSLSKCFEKVARRTDEPGKGMKWQIVPDQREDFLKKNMTLPRKPIARVGSSGPGSPAAAMSAAPAHASDRLHGALKAAAGPPQRAGGSGEAKTSPRSDTPPLTSYPTANESYTPDRGPRSASARHETMPTLVNGSSTETPFFLRSRGQLAAGDAAPPGEPLHNIASNSPPEIGPSTTNKRRGGLFGDYHNSTLPMQTPLGRHRPHLAPPSTAQLPSQHMLFSSPAPFWKYANLGSTPARPLEGWDSPEKKGADDSGDEEEEEADNEETMVDDNLHKEGENMALDDETSRPTTADENAAKAEDIAHVQASSPPLPKSASLTLDGLDAASGDDTSPIEDVSPSRTISRPVSRQLPGAQALNTNHLTKLNFGTAPVLSATPLAGGGGPVRMAPMPPQRRPLGGQVDEDEPIDLAK
ncbi:MAG: FHA domain-containing protein [Terriglobus roseus]|nr:FHA domain-containing protein [Terriglobus roseus]